MREIRRALAARRAAQVDSSDELDVSFDVRLRALLDELPLHAKLVGQLLHPSHDWNLVVDSPLPSDSGWRGALGRLVRPLVGLYADHPLRRQAQLNVYLVTLLRRSLRETVRLQLEVNALRRRT